jgi:hypothetical protein
MRWFPGQRGGGVVRGHPAILPPVPPLLGVSMRSARRARLGGDEIDGHMLSRHTQRTDVRCRESADVKDVSLVLLLLSFAQLSARGAGQGINYGKPVEGDGAGTADAAPDRLFTSTADEAHDPMTRTGEEDQVPPSHSSGQGLGSAEFARRRQFYIVARDACWV